MKGLLLAVALATGALAGGAETDSPPNLKGRVILPEGRPTKALVLLLGATLKPESSVTNRYPLFPIRTQTDADGNFKIESLDPAWLYHVFVLAPGCRPKVDNSFDPASGQLIAHLRPIDSSAVPPGNLLRGRILDSLGQPIPNALIRLQEVTRDNVWHFQPDNIDPFAVTDDAGNFAVSGQKAFADAGGAVEAPGFATKLFEHWESGPTTHELTLTKGAALKGRLLGNGKPIAKAEVRLDNFGHESGAEAWNYSAITDNEGRFDFRNLPPNRSFMIYATMASLGKQGALSKQPARVSGDDSTADLGDLIVQPSFKLSGHIRLSDGKPIPPHSRLGLARAHFVGLNDTISSPVTLDGEFSFVGVPAGGVTIYLRIPGYELTPKDRLLISGSATNYTVSGNLTDLVVAMNPQIR